MRKLLFTLILILAGYVGYLYFFGKGEDKENAELIVRETRDLGKAVGSFLQRQKGKYDEGEFDQLLDRVGKAVDNLKSSASQDDDEVRDSFKELQRELRQVDTEQLTEENRKELKKLLEDVTRELE